MPKKNEKIARQARVACEKWRAYFNQNIDLYHTMHSFILGDQWSDEEEDDMIKTYRKVPLVSNKLGTMANSLLGEQQQNTPQIEVLPLSGCDEETAYLREIIVKDIVFSSGGTTAYQVAASQAALGGFGAFCVDTDYVHEKSFDLDFVIRHFKDATRCYWDIGAESINKTDGSLCGYLSRMSRTKFRQMYGKDMEESVAKTSGITQNQEEIALAVQPDESENPFTWADDESITLIDHYVRKYEKDMLYKMSNGKTLNQEELDELIDKSMEINERNSLIKLQNTLEEMLSPAVQQEESSLDGFGIGGPHEILPQEPNTAVNVYGKEQNKEPIPEEGEIETLWDEGEMVRIEDKKSYKRHKIIHYRIAGDYILDETEFPSQQLPLVFVDNNSYYDKSGKQITRSFFGDCRDTQRYINYLRTQSAYILKVSRYDQWIGSKKNVSSLDTQRNWRDPTAIQGMLTYDESPSGAKPEQIMPPELSQSLFQQYQLAIEDLYTSSGLYPARMGNNGDEASGKAIDARTRQGSYSTFVFFNSINRAIAVAGEIVNEMIPMVYDTERVLSLMLPDKGTKEITVNKQIDEYGEHIENDIRKGTYKVRLVPGPSYEGQKEQALQSLREVLQVDPGAFNLIADLYAENLPLTNVLEIKNRLKTLVPPQIIEAGKTGEMPQQQGPNPEQQALQLQEQSQQQAMAIKSKELELKQQELELKKQEIIMEAQFKIQELETERLETAGKLKEQELRYMAESERTQSDQMIANADNLVRILTHKVQ